MQQPARSSTSVVMVTDVGARAITDSLTRQNDSADDGGSIITPEPDVGSRIYFLRHKDSGIDAKLWKFDAPAGDYQIIVLLPSGAVAASPLLTMGGGGPA